MYYRAIYDDFLAGLGELPYSIGGAQPIALNDPNVLGYVSNEQHQLNMEQYRLMFYHSQEPNHIHYHPFEAIRAGMPLVFMAGGMLDSMGGIGLPGRCKSISSARQKIKRILNDDWSLINRIKESQHVLLDSMKPSNCEAAWQKGFTRIEKELASAWSQKAARPLVEKPARIAVILPLGYRGGTLRGALLLAESLYYGSRAAKEAADVVFLHPDEEEYNSGKHFEDLPEGIACRSFRWNTLSADEARRAMRYAGFEEWEPSAENYIAPDDGIAQLEDCDLWLFISDRLSKPVLPLKPMVLVVYDYLQRYESILLDGDDQVFISTARSAQRVLVTTDFTYQDAVQYAGVEPTRVRKLPILAPGFSQQPDIESAPVRNYFMWTTNANPHKNHENAAEALRIYYEELDGTLACWVTGVRTRHLLIDESPHIKAMADIFAKSKALRKRVKWKGEMPDRAYRRALSQSRFLWHAGRIDNGTFIVIEAARLGTPSLSSQYPAMQEIDQQFGLKLAWMDPYEPREMAKQLRWMEEESSSRRAQLPAKNHWENHSVESLAGAYWQEVRQCL